MWTTNIIKQFTGQVSEMSFRVHLKELIYLSVASLILLILVWRLNTDSQESQPNDSQFSRFKLKLDPDIYRTKKVKIIQFNITIFINYNHLWKKSSFLNECLIENPDHMSLEYLPEYLNFSDQSTNNPEQESSIWTQGGIQRLVDRADQD